MTPAARVLATFLLAAVLALPQSAPAGVPVKSCLLYNATTGTLLYQKSADMKIPPASLTKVMTSYLVHDAMRRGQFSLGSRVRITQASASVGGSSMRLRSGERLPVWNLLEGMIIASGNDAATALAYRAGGSLNAFVGAMHTTVIPSHSGAALRNGTYSFPGSVRSQCISSEITQSPYFSDISPILSSSSLVQILPVGL